jgi:hypothetical protein
MLALWSFFVKRQRKVPKFLVRSGGQGGILFRSDGCMSLYLENTLKSRGCMGTEMVGDILAWELVRYKSMGRVFVAWTCDVVDRISICPVNRIWSRISISNIQYRIQYGFYFAVSSRNFELQYWGDYGLHKNTKKTQKNHKNYKKVVKSCKKVIKKFLHQFPCKKNTIKITKTQKSCKKVVKKL